MRGRQSKIIIPVFTLMTPRSRGTWGTASRSRLGMEDESRDMAGGLGSWRSFGGGIKANAKL